MLKTRIDKYEIENDIKYIKITLNVIDKIKSILFANEKDLPNKVQYIFDQNKYTWKSLYCNNVKLFVKTTENNLIKFNLDIKYITPKLFINIQKYLFNPIGTVKLIELHNNYDDIIGIARFNIEIIDAVLPSLYYFAEEYNSITDNIIKQIQQQINGGVDNEY